MLIIPHKQLLTNIPTHLYCKKNLKLGSSFLCRKPTFRTDIVTHPSGPVSILCLYRDQGLWLHY